MIHYKHIEEPSIIEKCDYAIQSDSSEEESNGFETIRVVGTVTRLGHNAPLKHHILPVPPPPHQEGGIPGLLCETNHHTVAVHHTGKPCKVYLNKGFRKIIWRTQDEVKNVNREVRYYLNDVIGLSAPVVNQSNNTVSMTLYTFSASSDCAVGCSRKPRDSSNAVKKNFVFTLPIHPTKQTLQHITHFYNLFNSIMFSGEGQKRPRKLVVFLNPFGGSGEAQHIYTTLVNRMFSQANIEIRYYQTESSDHISKLCQQVDLSDVHGIVGIGGDGLMHQIVNGIFLRPDASSLFSVPFGLIPAGSQNALAISINGFKTIEESTFSIIRGETRSLDLIEAFFPSENRHVYSLCAVAYGFIADVLKESELYRWMGPARYQFCAVKQFFKNSRAYRIKISYLPPNAVEENEDNWITIDNNEYDLVCGFNISGKTTQTPQQVPAQCDDGLITLLLIRSCSRLETIKYLLHTEMGTHHTLDYVEIIQAKSVKLIPDLSRASPVNVDGELHPTGPVNLKMLEKHLKTFVQSSGSSSSTNTITTTTITTPPINLL